jgi:thioredoxin reductase (NADPH)
MVLTDEIANYPGVETTKGYVVANTMKKQAKDFGCTIKSNITIDSYNLYGEVKHVSLTDGREFSAKSVILAPGGRPHSLNIPGENEFKGTGISYCATCDGHFFQGKDVIVVGGGDSALEEGLFLTRYVNSVKIIHRRDELRAGAILQNRAFKNDKVEFIWDSVVTEITGDGIVDTVKLKNVKTGAEDVLKTDGVFIFIGHIPNTDIYEGQVELDENGYVQVDRFMQTSVPGVYAAGEVADSHFRQVITSAGMGAGAAMQAIHFLEDHSS